MRIQALSTFALLVLGAALGQARSPIAVRRPQGDTTLPQPDPHAINTDGPRVLLISPTSLQNHSATFNTCDPVYFWWFYDPQFMDNPDKFNLSITNVGVNQNPPPPPATTTDPVISSDSNLGSLPTANPGGPPKATFPVETPGLPPVSRRADGDVTLLLTHDQAIFVKEHYFFWPAITVPEGYYVLRGVDTNPASNVPIEDSASFYIGAGDTSCSDGSNGGGGGQGTPSPTSPSGNDAAQTGGPTAVSSSGSNKTGIIAGAVVGSILGLLAVAGLFFLAAVHRRQKANKARGTAWGQVGSSDSQGGSRARAIGLPVGAANRLSRNAEASVKGEFGVDSMDEKYAGGVSRSGSASTGHSAFSPEPPVFQRHSQTSQAFPLGMLSTRESRRSTIQSIPTTVTPHGTPLPSPSPVPAPGAVLTRSTSNVGATGAKKTPRKPVPAYDPNEMSRETLAGGSTPPKRSSTDAGRSSTDADSGAQGMSSSQRTTSTVLSAFPFELDGAQGQVHYLIPDPPVSPKR